MSRKEPSFGQLATYMTDDKSDRDFDLHQHVFSRAAGDIAREFEVNARLLAKRKNGNYLYHEILSLDTRACGQGREVKERLRLLALEYVARRCPGNMVFGAMHQDHAEHLHYHLMISANEKDDRRRHRLPKASFEAAKRETERQALEEHPELMQSRVMDLTLEERTQSRVQRKSRKQQEMEKRGARPTRKEAAAKMLRSALAYAASQDELERVLADQGFRFYQRGKNFCIQPIASEGTSKNPKAMRLSTLGVLDDFEAFLERVEPLVEAEREAAQRDQSRARHDAGLSDDTGAASEKTRFEGEKEKEADVGGDGHVEAARAAQDVTPPRSEPDAPSRADTPSPEVQPPDFYAEMQERQAKRAAKKAARSEQGGKRRGKPRR